jgi:anti-sigma regulatory factor (Ser/Thr protein kinase)
MEAVLTALLDVWLDGDDALGVLDQASVSVVRQRVRECANALAMPASALDPFLIVATELAQNQLAHAAHGWVSLRRIERDGVLGLELVAADAGPGIKEPTAALRGTTASPHGIGAGLGAVLRLADEVDIDTRRGEGTCVWARKFCGNVARRRQVGVVGKHHPHEIISGDDALFRRTQHGLAVAVADGLGHGPDARLAATEAVSCLARVPDGNPERVLEASHTALLKTRGAVMAVVQIPEAGEPATGASVGNVSVRALGPGVATRFGGTSFTLGLPAQQPRIRVEELVLRHWDALIVFTDGISSRAKLDDTDLLLEHPLLVANAFLERFSVAHDDALVLVAR